MNLLLIALGPVQDFIAHARRSRDLWFGSHLLSELSRATAKSLADQGWELIFPALDSGDPELEPSEGMRRAQSALPPLSIVNKVLARGAGDPQIAAEQAREAARSRWRIMASHVQAKVGRILRQDADLAGALDDVLEFYAAWTTCTDLDYSEQRVAIESAIAERKHIRDFPAWTGQHGLPKSSLDGFRESVLDERNPAGRLSRLESDAKAAELVRRFRISPNEHLDAMGVMKRMGEDPDQFVPVWRIAMEPWIAAVEMRARREPELWAAWTALQRECRAQAVRTIQPNATAWVQKFAFDGELFVQERWGRLFSDEDVPIHAHWNSGQEFGQRYVKPILSQVGQPLPSYLACLVADGDHMGRTLRGLPSPALHRQFSACLLEFARSVRGLVENHGGALVYAGGDDVLAFLPVAEALGCAEALKEQFTDSFARLASAISMDQPCEFHPPTLSVGIGINHVMTPMSDLLEIARDAERMAKGPRDALAIIIEKRGGDETRVCLPWQESPAQHFRAFVKALHTEVLPTTAPFEVRDLLLRFPRPAQVSASAQAEWAAILHADLARTLQRKGERSARLSPEGVWLPAEPGQSYSKLHETIAAWIERAKVAHFLLDFAQAIARVDKKSQGQAVAA